MNKKLNPIVFASPPNKIPNNIEIAYDIKNIFLWNKSMFFNILKVAIFKLNEVREKFVQSQFV